MKKKKAFMKFVGEMKIQLKCLKVTHNPIILR